MKSIMVTVPNVTETEDTSYTAIVDREQAVRLGAQKLGAVQVGKSYYYVAEETNEVYKLTAREVAMLGAGEIDERGADYSLWSSTTGQLIQRPTSAVKAALGL